MQRLNLLRRLSTACSRLPQTYLQQQPAKDDLVLVAMSSGVDSSVAAALCSQRYKNCRGVFMANWSQLDSERCLEQDAKDVERVSSQLGIPLEMVNFEKDYWIDVFEPMVQAYSKGITPNPDINCNRYVKFGKLVEYLSQKYKGQNWWLVTGHYARVLSHKETGKLHLLRAIHRPKDQSYYMSQIAPNVLEKLLLPIGHYTKPEVRKLAKEMGLAVADKPDSQGLCFVSQTQGDFKAFLKNFIDESPGNIITQDGKVWGKHEGLWSYTIGQKCGISMPQGDPRYKGQWFVSDKDFGTNDIIIVRGTDNEKLFKKYVYLSDFFPLEDGLDLNDFDVSELEVQYRSLQKPLRLASIKKVEDKLLFELSSRARAIAAGQYLAVYHKDRCLGSGTIRYAE